MNLLVIGSGGREHAIVWKLAQSPRVRKIYCTPGNVGIAALAECVDIAGTDVEALADFAKRQKIDLTVVGPEAALAAGVVDRFQQQRLKIFGPTQSAAQLESSKAFTKEFCLENKIPQAGFGVATDIGEAKRLMETFAFPIVVKADGLAAGKGVTICQTYEEAVAAVTGALIGGKFGSAGKKIVIEEFLRGEETSFIAIVDGEQLLPLETARDYKRLLDGDQGPNTGGMGTVSPSPLMTPVLQKKIMEKIMHPTVRGMKRRGIPFTGFLYAGLMIADGEPKLLEFNVRLGDPETQVLLPRLQSDLVPVLEAALDNKLDLVRLDWDQRRAVCVVMASRGYPDAPVLGSPVFGLENAQTAADALIFHAGTKRVGDKITVSGGRVLGVTGLGDDLQKARKFAYSAVARIHWDGIHYRKDIGGSHA